MQNTKAGRLKKHKASLATEKLIAVQQTRQGKKNKDTGCGKSKNKGEI